MRRARLSRLRLQGRGTLMEYKYSAMERPIREALDAGNRVLVIAPPGMFPLTAIWRASEGPLRAPHHTVNAAALIGPYRSRSAPDVAASVKRPGEVDLAQDGLLVFDDLPEFSKLAISSVGHALKDEFRRVAVVARASPCRCGFYRAAKRQCTCRERVVRRSAARRDEFAALLGIGIDR